MVNTVEKVIVDDENSVWGAFRDNLKIFEEEVGGAIDQAFGTIIKRTKDKLRELDDAVSSAQRSRRTIGSILRGVVRSAAVRTLPLFV